MSAKSMRAKSSSASKSQVEVAPDADVIDGGLEGYIVKRPIQITYEDISDTEVQARFGKGNFAVAGVSRQDAFQALVEEILAAFDDWNADEPNLGPGPRQQLAVLRNYLGKGTS